MKQSFTVAEIEGAMGERLRALRLSQNLDQKTLAERAGLSLRAVKNVESGSGSTLRSLVSVLRVLGREEWLLTIAQMPTINPLTLTRTAQPRQRASRKPSKAQDAN